MLTVVDQVLYTASNLLMLALIARASSVADFGAYSLVYAIFGFAASVNQASIGETVLLGPRTGSQIAVTKGLGASLLSSLPVALVIAGSAAFVSDSFAFPLLALAGALPFLLVQDTYRLTAFAEGLPHKALLNDLLRIAVQVVLTVGIFVLGSESPGWMLVIWSASGAFAGLVALVPSFKNRPWSRIADSWRWMLAERDRLLPFGTESLVLSGFNQSSFFAIAGVAGLPVVGAVRAVQTLFGPQQVIQYAIRTAGLAELAKRADQRKRLNKGVLALIACGLVLAVGWAGSLMAMPDGLGAAILGESFLAARDLFVSMGAQRVVLAVTVGLLVAVRILGAGWGVAGGRMLNSALRFVLVVVGAWHWDAAGAVMGLLVAELFNFAGLMMSYKNLRRKASVATKTLTAEQQTSA